MSKAPELIQIRPEDYDKDARKVIDKLAGPLNNFLLQITELLTQSLTFADNFNAEVKSQTIVGGKSLTLKLNNIVIPKGVVLMSYTNTTTPSEILTAAVGVPQWSADGRGNITINSIPGLTNDNNYAIILLVVGG